MPKHAVVFILGTVVTASASLAATSSRDSTSQNSAVHAPTVPEVFQSTPRKDPYGRLFTPKPDRQMPTAARESSAQQRPAPDARVVCGMKVIPVDASVDRKMVIPIPPQAAKESRIRVIELPPCARQ